MNYIYTIFWFLDELGDFNPKRDVHGYASQFEFMPNQSIELEKAAEAKHMKLKYFNKKFKYYYCVLKNP